MYVTVHIRLDEDEYPSPYPPELGAVGGRSFVQIGDELRRQKTALKEKIASEINTLDGMDVTEVRLSPR
jgi:hypothetical protein